jgi:hypothetical protein
MFKVYSDRNKNRTALFAYMLTEATSETTREPVTIKHSSLREIVHSFAALYKLKVKTDIEEKK